MARVQSVAFKAFRGAITLALLACIPAAFAWMRMNSVEESLSADELTIHDARITAKDVVWVDARSEEDYARGHVTGAVLLNEKEWDSRIGNLFEVWQPEHSIIVYCNAGCQASHKVADRIRELGMEPVLVLKGGYDAWRQSHPEP